MLRIARKFIPGLDTFTHYDRSWLPVSVRLGDGLAAVTVLVGVHLLAMSARSFFVFNLSLVIFLDRVRADFGWRAPQGRAIHGQSGIE